MHPLETSATAALESGERLATEAAIMRGEVRAKVDEERVAMLIAQAIAAAAASLKPQVRLG